MEKEKIIINSQFALFFDQPIMKPEEFWQGLNSKMDNIFDQTPTILPVPNDPNLNDVPIVQMKSSTGIYSCNISRGRADFFHAGSGKEDFAVIKNNFIKEVSNLFIFFKDNPIKVKRIGFVSRFFVQDDDQDKTIAKLLNDEFKKIHGENTYETYVRHVSRDEIDEFKINNLTTIEKFFARIAGAVENTKGILITRDFNTVPGEENYKDVFTVEKIKSFIEKSEEKFKLDDINKILW